MKSKWKRHHYIYHIWTDAKKGYDNYSWLFFIVTIATIIGAAFKVTGGVLVILIAFVFFYIAGRFHTRFEKDFNRWAK